MIEIYSSGEDCSADNITSGVGLSSGSSDLCTIKHVPSLSMMKSPETLVMSFHTS